MDSRVPLSALLSQPLVAFTIEFDNEFEHRAPHRTTLHGATPSSHHAPWLVSMVMWTKVLRFVPDAGIAVHELQRQARLTLKDLLMWLQRLAKWWGYIEIKSGPAPARSKTQPAEWIVRPTAGGRKAIEVWRPLTGVIERRWQERFGKKEIENLRAALRTLIDCFEFEPADSLPIVGFGLFTKRSPRDELVAPTGADSVSENMLSALLSKTLLAFALEFERDSEVALAISANVLRLVAEEGVPVADLPRLSAVSKEAIAMSVSFLQKNGYAKLAARPAKMRGKLLTLTAKGRHARDTYGLLTQMIEDRWTATFGEDKVRRLREALERLVGEPGSKPARLLLGCKPYPEGWRSSAPRSLGLPHYPMILHRGGFPDGS